MLQMHHNQHHRRLYSDIPTNKSTDSTTVDGGQPTIVVEQQQNWGYFNKTISIRPSFVNERVMFPTTEKKQNTHTEPNRWTDGRADRQPTGMAVEMHCVFGKWNDFVLGDSNAPDNTERYFDKAC